MLLALADVKFTSLKSYFIVNGYIKIREQLNLFKNMWLVVTVSCNCELFSKVTNI